MSTTHELDRVEPFFPLPGGSPFCRVVPGFLSRQECRRLIADSEARGFAAADGDYPPSYRNNERQVLDDPALARQLLPRLRAFVPETARPAGLEPSMPAWTLDSINERFRLCRYRGGQQFGIHQDGVHHRSRTLQSCLTFMVYLTDADEFEGGDTLFHESGPAGSARVIARVRPRAGSLIVFDHRLWHAGERVTSGVKHVLRSDVLYRAPSTACPTPPQPFEPGHQGYVWTLEALDADTLASGGRDTAIHVWRQDGRLVRTLQGHTRSVLGLARLPGGRLASVSRDRSLRLWDWRAGSCERVVEGAHAAAILGVAALSAGAFATAGADGLVRVWNRDATPGAILAGHRGWVWAVAAVAEGLIASASEDGCVRLWDLDRGACLHTLPGSVPLRSLAVAADGRHIVTSNIEGMIAVWSRSGDGWAPERSFRAHAAAARRVRLLSDSLLASAGEDDQVRLWTLPACTLHHAQRHANFATDVLAMGDIILSCAYDGRIRRLQSHD